MQNQPAPSTPRDADTSVYHAANDGFMELSVGEPVLVKQTIGDYHAYPIKGRDSKGEVDCQRRFQIFYDFRSVLCQRFPGLYIPPIPKKTSSQKKNAIVLRERQFFLDLFLKECATLRYLCQSKELQVFLRPEGDVEASLKKLHAKTKTTEQLAIYRACLEVQEDFADNAVGQLNNEISVFVADQKSLLTHLLAFKKQIKAIVPIKE